MGPRCVRWRTYPAFARSHGLGSSPTESSDLEIYGEKESVSVADACKKFLADCEARKLSPGITKKYDYVTDELIEEIRGSIDPGDKSRRYWGTEKRLEICRLDFVEAFGIRSDVLFLLRPSGLDSGQSCKGRKGTESKAHSDSAVFG